MIQMLKGTMGCNCAAMKIFPVLKVHYNQDQNGSRSSTLAFFLNSDQETRMHCIFTPDNAKSKPDKCSKITNWEKLKKQTVPQ